MTFVDPKTTLNDLFWPKNDLKYLVLTQKLVFVPQNDILRKKPCNWAKTLTVSLLTAATDSKFKLQPDDPNWLFPRGAAQRNKGLDFVSGLGVYNSFVENSDSGRIVDFGKHLTTTPVNNSAVVYFADGDNTYDHELFAELTKIPRGYRVFSQMSRKKPKTAEKG